VVLERSCRLFLTPDLRSFSGVMIKSAFLFILGLLWVPYGSLCAQSAAVEFANMREDVRLLTQRVGELQLRLEQLEKENGDLRAKTAGAAQSYATLAQLNDAIADINRTIKAGDAATKAETLQQVGVQMEKLATRTNTALDSLARGIGGRGAGPSAPPTFSDDFPKEGVPHVVQTGESLSSIARKYGAKPQDIINANKITDASKIQVGQTLFIPGGK
jgi:LysM repeat protein